MKVLTTLKLGDTVRLSKPVDPYANTWSKKASHDSEEKDEGRLGWIYNISLATVNGENLYQTAHGADVYKAKPRMKWWKRSELEFVAREGE